MEFLLILSWNLPSLKYTRVKDQKSLNIYKIERNTMLTFSFSVGWCSTEKTYLILFIGCFPNTLLYVWTKYFNIDSYDTTGRFWMDNLYCTGEEKNLSSCRFDGWGANDCTSSESAGVVCMSPEVTATEETTTTPEPPKKGPLIRITVLSSYFNTFSI